SFACLTINKKKLVSDLEKILEAAYKKAFVKCSERKALATKLLKRANKEKARKKAEAEKKAAVEKETAEAGKRMRGGKGKQRQQRGKAKKKEEEEEEEIGEVGSSVQWTERGIPNFAGTAAHENRNKRSSKSEVSLSQKARDKMPSFDDFMDALDPDTGKFPLEDLTLT
ncbi:unnamed protein product, partial [Pylaiella littoralis]